MSSFGSSAAIYGLKFGARCIAAVTGAPDAHRFWVGTNSCKDRNELHLIEYDDSDDAGAHAAAASAAGGGARSGLSGGAALATARGGGSGGSAGAAAGAIR